MNRYFLLSIILLMFFSGAIAQEKIVNSEVQGLMNAVVGQDVNILISQLPQGIDISFPDTIKVLGTLEFDGSMVGLMPPIPNIRLPNPDVPIDPSMHFGAPFRAFEVVLDSELAYSELNQIFDDVLSTSGYMFFNDNSLYIQREPQWGFVQYKKLEPQQIDRTYCNETHQLWISGHQNEPSSAVPFPQRKLRMYIGFMRSPTICQEQVQALNQQAENRANYLVGNSQTVPRSSYRPLKSIWELPKLLLPPPINSEYVAISSPSRFPDTFFEGKPTTRINPSWLNRAVIETSLSDETLYSYYTQELSQQGWVMVRKGVNTPFGWSEWEVTAPDDTDWIGVLQFTTDTHFKQGVVMITFQVFEK